MEYKPQVREQRDKPIKRTRKRHGKTRRGRGNKKCRNENKNKVKFALLGSNCNGLNPKKESLFHVINEFKPSVVTLQETKVKNKGSIKVKGYQIFEKTRNGKGGGGLLTAVDEDLEPVLVSTGQDDVEILTVETKLGNSKIRVINGYGPQEDEEKQITLNFWLEIEKEVLAARDNGCMILIEMDANAKVGNEVIANDPHEQTNNGKILLDIVNRHDLVIVNALELCKGVITRERVFEKKVEKSAIDYVVICRELYDFLTSMIIDEERLHVLTNSARNRTTLRRTTSDHNILYCNFSICFNRQPRRLRREFFNFKCEEGKIKFLEETTSSKGLSKCFSESDNFSSNCDNFFKSLNRCFHKCFTKIRIRTGKNKSLGDEEIQDKLNLKLEIKRFLKNNTSKIGKAIAEAKLDEVEHFLDEQCGKKNAETVKNHVSKMETMEGNFCQLGMWKIKRKLCPQIPDPPMAKLDENGSLVTAPNLLKDLYLRTYVNRLSHRKMKPEYNDIYCLKMELWSSRLKLLKNTKTPSWKMEHLDTVLKSLKTNKTMDPHGIINEIFKEGCIGLDLKIALLSLFNGTKREMFMPMFMALSNITTLFKNKGSRLDMNNDRGIFILTTLKKILDKLIYNDKYADLDENMTDSNIGARKGRNIRNHLMIIYGVINSVIKGGEDCVDLQIYDLEKAFDALWLEDCLNDLYDTLSKENRNDKLALLFESNAVNQVAVKTAVGLTKRVSIPRVVQQGGTWGSMLCSNSIDTLAKKCSDRGEHYYLYKGTARILPLAMVDDYLGISKCGFKSLELNAFITSQIELKKLRFHTPDKNGKTKCHKLHIGKNHSKCPDLKVHGTLMSEVKSDTYLGDVLSADGRNTENIKSRVSKGLGIVSQIMNLLDIVNFGEHYFEIGLLLRESMLINGILTNSEVWYNLLKTETKELEDIDKLLLKRMLNVPDSTPGEAFYLEMGILPISVIIKARRINYLYYLLSRDESEMISSFFFTQWNNPCRGDWTDQIKIDLEDFGIDCNFDFIRSKSQWAFKNMVKNKAKEYALKKLTQKQATHSKMDGLYYHDLKTQKYLKSPSIKLNQKRTIFRWRTRMESFGEHFRGGGGPVMCPLCQTHLDNQAMSLQCPGVKEEINVEHHSIEGIFAENISQEVVELISRITKIRENKLGLR